MKITMYNGSPWANEGHTHFIAQEFLFGAAKAGARIQAFHLAKKNITLCNRCGGCFYKTPGKCTIRDDMDDMIEKFITSDIVILATPVYIDNVTALMKMFIDRLVPILEPHYAKDENGRYRRCTRLEKCPKLIIIGTCSLPELSQFEVISLFFKRMARTLHTEIAAEIYRPAAGLLLLSREDIRFKPVVDNYRKILNDSGKDFARKGFIGSETLRKINEPIIHPDMYAEYANQIWDKLVPPTRFSVSVT